MGEQGPDDQGLVQVVYELAVLVSDDDPAPTEHDIATAILDRCNWIKRVVVQRA